MRRAFKYCTEAGILKQLSKKLNRADITGEYKSYVGAAPWMRYPATLVLKPLCAMLTVRIFHRVDFASN